MTLVFLENLENSENNPITEFQKFKYESNISEIFKIPSIFLKKKSNLRVENSLLQQKMRVFDFF
jgi:hypothetical protein